MSLPGQVALGQLEDEISSTDHSDNTGFTSGTLNTYDYFGRAVTLDGDTLAVGAYGDDGCTNCGAVYIFTRSGSTWSLQKEISDTSTVTGFTGTTLNTYDYFGYSVALSGNTLVAGAYGDDGGCSGCGAVYVFTRSGSTWSLEDEISNTDHSDNPGFGSGTLNNSEAFGRALDLDSDTLVVGAYLDHGSDSSDAGAVYIFSRNGSTWSLKQDIYEQSSGFTDLGYQDYFGYAVAVDGNTLVAGAYNDD